MKYLNKLEIAQKGYTNKELRQMVYKRIGELNVRLTDNEELIRDTEYILEDTGYINRKGQVSFNTYISKMNKKQLIETYNDLTSAIKQDTSSPYYHANVTAMDKQMLKKVNKTMKLQGEREISMAQFQEFMRIKDEFGDVFGKDDIYEIIKTIKNLRGKHQRPFIELIRESKEELEDSETSYTKEDVLRLAQQKSGLWEYQPQSVDPRTGERLEKPKGW